MFLVIMQKGTEAVKKFLVEAENSVAACNKVVKYDSDSGEPYFNHETFISARPFKFVKGVMEL